MDTGKKEGFFGLFGLLAEKMKANRRVELAVYAVLAAAGILLFALTSCNADTDARKGAAAGGTLEGGSLETRLEQTLSKMEGAGEVAVMLNENDEGILGVIVVAQGARDIATRVMLHNAVCTALGLDATQVEIYSMENNEGEE